MTRRRPAQRRMLAALLFLACLMAGGVLALHRTSPDLMVLRMAGGQDAPLPAQIPVAVPMAGQSAIPQPESRFAVIALKPLFTPTRRPQEGPEAPVETPVNAPPDLLVTGIVMAGADSVAILEPVRAGPKAKPAMVARIGGDVEGWTVEAIEAGLVVLTRDGKRHELALIDEDDPRRANAVRRRTPATGQARPANPQGQPLQPRQPQAPAQQPIPAPKKN